MKVFAAVMVVVGLVAASSFGAVDVTLKAQIGSTTYTGSVPASAYTAGVPVTVQVWVQDTTSGVLGLGGDIISSGAASFTTPTQGATWLVKTHQYQLLDADSNPKGQFVTIYDVKGSFAGNLPSANIYFDPALGEVFDGYIFPTSGGVGNHKPGDPFNVGGIPGANGAMGGLGSGQALSPSPDNTFARSAAVMVASYVVNWTSATGPTTLGWYESGKPGATSRGGWYTTGVALDDDTVGTISNITFLPEPITLSLFALGGLLVARRPVRNR